MKIREMGGLASRTDHSITILVSAACGDDRKRHFILNHRKSLVRLTRTITLNVIKTSRLLSF